MTILSLLTKTPPTLGYGDMVLEFDAVIEDTLEASVQLSDYPLELGSRSNDHRVKNPIKWTMTGAISNNPLKVSVTDFTGILSEVSSENGTIAKTAGILAGALSGDEETRSSDVLQALLKLMYEGEPFTINSGDITLNNMVIENIRRTKDASNESGLIFVASLREWQDIATAISAGSASQTNSEIGSSTASSASQFIKKGQKSLKDAGDAINDTIEGWFSSDA